MDDLPFEIGFTICEVFNSQNLATLDYFPENMQDVMPIGIHFLRAEKFSVIL